MCTLITFQIFNVNCYSNIHASQQVNRKLIINSFEPPHIIVENEIGTGTNLFLKKKKKILN